MLKLVENLSFTSGRMKQHSSIYLTTPAHALGTQELLHWKTEHALRIKGKKPKPLESLELISSHLC